MRSRRILIAAAAVAALAAGSVGAVAATSKDEGKGREDAVLGDAAKRLGVTPDKLRDALGAAQDAQLDRAVKEGRLTQEQADAMKERRRQSGRVLGGPGHRHGGRGPHGFGRGLHGGPIGDVMGAVAKALGLSQDELLEQLRDGKSVADIAKAEGKDLDEVKAAGRTAVTKALDEAVQDGKLTDAQRDRIIERLDQHIDRLAERGLPRFHGGRGPGPGGP